MKLVHVKNINKDNITTYFIANKEKIWEIWIAL